jgi:hypothetical protein
MSSEEYLALPGSSAYSEFRLAALKESINAVLIAKAITARAIAVSGIWVYYVNGWHGAHLGSKSSLPRKTLEQLLGVGDSRELAEIVGFIRY